jgi:hypothetical protein
LSKYSKFFVALSGVLLAAGEALSDGSVDATDAAQVVGAALIAFGVYRVPNKVER